MGVVCLGFFVFVVDLSIGFFVLARFFGVCFFMILCLIVVL